MKLKNLLATVLVFALILSLGGMAAFAAAPWYGEALDYLVGLGVMPGEAKAAPSSTLTRGDIYTYAGKALGVSMSAPSGASETATREDMFLLLAEVTGAELSTYDSADSFLKGFSDYSSISSSAKTPIAALIKAGYINGVPSGGVMSLYPTNKLTNAEFAVLASRVFGQIVDSPGALNSNINGNVTVRTGVTLSGIIVKGDLIIGEGSKISDVSINDSAIRGRVIVRGPASLSVNARSSVGTIHNYSDLTFSGDATTLNIREKGSTIRLSGGTIRDVNVESDNNKITVGTGMDIAFLTVVSNGNDITGTGTVGNAGFLGSNNKFDVPGASVITDSGRGNTLSSKSGTFNVVGADITSNTTITVEFDAKIQTAPASAFTLSGNARSAANSANPNSTSISSDGKTVTLTFTGATFNNVGYNSGTIECSTAVISSEKSTLGTKSANVGWQGNFNNFIYYYNPVIDWDNAVRTGGGATISSVSGAGAVRNLTISINAGSGTSIAFTSGASSMSMTTLPSVSNTVVKLTYNPGYNFGFGGGYGGIYGYGSYYIDGTWYPVNRRSNGTYYYIRGGSEITFPSNDPKWDYYSGGFGGNYGGAYGYGRYWPSGIGVSPAYDVNYISGVPSYRIGNTGSWITITDYSKWDGGGYNNGSGTLDIGGSFRGTITIVSTGNNYNLGYNTITYSISVVNK